MLSIAGLIKQGSTACKLQQHLLLQEHPPRPDCTNINHIINQKYKSCLPTLPMIFITSLVFILSTLRRLSIIAIGVFKIQRISEHESHHHEFWTTTFAVFPNHPRRSKSRRQRHHQVVNRNIETHEFVRRANQLSTDDQLQQPPSILATNLEVIGSELARS